MNKEIFDLRNCVIMELVQYDYFMKMYYENKSERNELQERIDKAIEYFREKVGTYEEYIHTDYIYEMINILKGSDSDD